MEVMSDSPLSKASGALPRANVENYTDDANAPQAGLASKPGSPHAENANALNGEKHKLLFSRDSSNSLIGSNEAIPKGIDRVRSGGDVLDPSIMQHLGAEPQSPLSSLDYAQSVNGGAALMNEEAVSRRSSVASNNVDAGPPDFLAKNPKMQQLWSTVSKRPTMSNLDQVNSKETQRLKGAINNYHGALDELQKNIAGLEPEQILKKKAADSDTGAEELRELQSHLYGLMQMNKDLADIKSDDFPGDDQELQDWQTSLQEQHEAFQELVGLIEGLIQGNYGALFGDEEEKKK